MKKLLLGMLAAAVLLTCCMPLSMSEKAVPTATPRWVDISKPTPARRVATIATIAPPAVSTRAPYRTSTPMPAMAVVTAHRLNVRTGPGVCFEVLGQWEYEDVLLVIDVFETQDQGTWVRVSLDGTRSGKAAYVAGGWVKIKGDYRTVKTGVMCPAKPEPTRPKPKAPACNYVASRNKAPFHYPWCKWGQKIASYNLVCYETREQAIRDGHRPCKVCNP